MYLCCTLVHQRKIIDDVAISFTGSDQFRLSSCRISRIPKIHGRIDCRSMIEPELLRFLSVGRSHGLRYCSKSDQIEYRLAPFVARLTRPLLPLPSHSPLPPSLCLSVTLSLPPPLSHRSVIGSTYDTTVQQYRCLFTLARNPTSTRQNRSPCRYYLLYYGYHTCPQFYDQIFLRRESLIGYHTSNYK